MFFMTLREIDLGNRNSERTYRDDGGKLWKLSRCFQAFGPFTPDHLGALPRLLVDGREYWGDGIDWRRAEAAFRVTVRELRAKA